MKYTCSQCGKEHESWPALTYPAPSPYFELTEEEKSQAVLNEDFCVIEYPDQIDRFIRCTLRLKVNDHCSNLDYGIWVSLSENSYHDYTKHFDNPNHHASYFGYISNYMVGYDNSFSVPTTVHTQSGKTRPMVVPHEDFDHPLVKDYFEGISKEEAEERIDAVLKK